jgi:ubiquinone/menaquinone biosynthesis C-methylase UbiE
VADYLPALRFRRLTRIYDPAIRWTTREATFKRRLLGQAGIEAGDRVLDLGCGTGTLALMAKRSQPGAVVSGLDADPEMLAPARRKAAEAGLGISFDEGLATALPYPDDFFDRVLSSLFFHHLVLEEKRRTVAELARVLRPGGELHVADFGRPRDPAMRAISLLIRLGDGDAPTRDNLSGALPRVFEAGGLVDAAETGTLRTPAGSISFYGAAAG